jgi:competence protein ComFC
MRDGALKELIHVYKYDSVRSASFVFAELLNSVIDRGFCLVPLPTIGAHIRERGFDHVELFCRKTGLPVEKVLYRAKDSVQVGATCEQRREQAKRAYGIKGSIRGDKRYLLVDDVWTTGSSMMAAAEILRAAGTKNLAIAVIARSI